MGRPWLTVISLIMAASSLVGVVVLALSYKSLRQKIDRIAVDVVQFPSSSVTGREHFEVRLAAIASQLAQVERPVIVAGDSIVELAALPSSICGHPLINAGLGGAKVEFLARYAQRFRSSRPALVVFSVGINDAIAKTPDASFRQSYMEALNSVASPTAVTLITPTNSTYVEATAVNQFNALILSLGVPAIDANGKLNSALASDGIHLSAAGYAIWTREIERSISEILRCRD